MSFNGIAPNPPVHFLENVLNNHYIRLKQKKQVYDYDSKNTDNDSTVAARRLFCK